MTITLICSVAAVYTFQAQAQTDAYQDCKPVYVQTVDVPAPADAAAEKARIEKLKREGKG